MIQVLEPGLIASIQAAPRRGYRHFGVPGAGPFAPHTFQVANLLLGNDPFAPALEMLGFGGVFVATSPVLVTIAERSSGVIVGRREWLEPGQTLDLRTPADGVAKVLALPGGIDSQPILGSLSGHVVQKKDALSPKIPRYEKLATGKAEPIPLFSGPIPLVLRPEFPQFESLEVELRISPNSNRMGTRLTGFPHPHSIELPSQPVNEGWIQWTSSGEFIVLGPDGPTIGGYPVIARLYPALFDSLRQLPTGAAFQATLTSEMDAVLEYENAVSQSLKQLRLSAIATS